eukprot:scaffold320_cov335-Pavlova_lutheri.AAC.34
MWMLPRFVRGLWSRKIKCVVWTAQLSSSKFASDLTFLLLRRLQDQVEERTSQRTQKRVPKRASVRLNHSTQLAPWLDNLAAGHDLLQSIHQSRCYAWPRPRTSKLFARFCLVAVNARDTMECTGKTNFQYLLGTRDPLCTQRSDRSGTAQVGCRLHATRLVRSHMKGAVTVTNNEHADAGLRHSPGLESSLVHCGSNCGFMKSIYSTRWKCSGVIATCLVTPPSYHTRAGHLCSNFHLFKTRGGPVHVLFETPHLALGSVADLRALIDRLDGDIQTRLLLSVRGRESTCALHKQGEGSHLEGQPQLRLGGGGGHVGEHSLFLDQDLEHIGDHSPRVPERVLFSDPEVHQPLVVGIVEGCAQVSRREHLSFADLVGVLGVDPLSVVLEQELVGSGVSVDGDHVVGAGSVDCDSSRGHVPTGLSNDGLSSPHPEDGPHREVGVYDGGSIQRIEADGELVSAHVLFDGVLFGRAGGADARITQCFEEQVVGQDVHGQLFVSEAVEAGHPGAGSGSHLECDGAACFGHGQHHLPQLRIRGGFHHELFQAVSDLRLGRECGGRGASTCGGGSLASHGRSQLVPAFSTGEGGGAGRARGGGTSSGASGGASRGAPEAHVRAETRLCGAREAAGGHVRPRTCVARVPGPPKGTQTCVWCSENGDEVRSNVADPTRNGWRWRTSPPPLGHQMHPSGADAPSSIPREHGGGSGPDAPEAQVHPDGVPRWKKGS